MARGVLHSINVSNGGVPKLPVAECALRATGLEGDRQRDLRYHGGPLRAVSLYSLDLIEALQAEGHPIAPGTIGENLTLSGLRWTDMVPGATVEVGEAILELTSHAHPCRKIAGSFRGGDMSRVHEKTHPGWGRLYARVVQAGTVRIGDVVRLRPAPPVSASA